MDTRTHTHSHTYSNAHKANPSGHSKKKINSKWFYMVEQRESERKEKTKKRGLRKGGKTSAAAAVAGDEDGQCVYTNGIGCVLPVRFRNTRYEFGFSHPPIDPSTHPPSHWHWHSLCAFPFAYYY